MELDALIEGISTEGYRLAEAAEAAGLDANVPSCPRWRVRDLVRHTGGVHHWAGAHLRSPQKGLINSGPLGSQFGGWPSDDRLFDWYRGEVDLLVESLKDAPDDIETATFLPAPTPKHFWARRQCHEVEIHRTDAELAANDVTSIDPDRAADGIDELLAGFLSRNTGKLRSSPSVRLLFAPDDVPQRWLFTISDGPPQVTYQVTGVVDQTLRGRADVLFRCLWNRADEDDVVSDGNPAPLKLFKERVKIRWS